MPFLELPGSVDLSSEVVYFLVKTHFDLFVDVGHSPCRIRCLHRWWLCFRACGHSPAKRKADTRSGIFTVIVGTRTAKVQARKCLGAFFFVYFLFFIFLFIFLFLFFWGRGGGSRTARWWPSKGTFTFFAPEVYEHKVLTSSNCRYGCISCKYIKFKKLKIRSTGPLRVAQIFSTFEVELQVKRLCAPPVSHHTQNFLRFWGRSSCRVLSANRKLRISRSQVTGMVDAAIGHLTHGTWHFGKSNKRLNKQNVALALAADLCLSIFRVVAYCVGRCFQCGWGPRVWIENPECVPSRTCQWGIPSSGITLDPWPAPYRCWREWGGPAGDPIRRPRSGIRETVRFLQRKDVHGLKHKFIHNFSQFKLFRFLGRADLRRPSLRTFSIPVWPQFYPVGRLHVQKGWQINFTPKQRHGGKGVLSLAGALGNLLSAT